MFYPQISNPNVTESVDNGLQVDEYGQNKPCPTCIGCRIPPKRGVRFHVGSIKFRLSFRCPFRPPFRGTVGSAVRVAARKDGRNAVGVPIGRTFRRLHSPAAGSGSRDLDAESVAARVRPADHGVKGHRERAAVCGLPDSRLQAPRGVRLSDPKRFLHRCRKFHDERFRVRPAAARRVTRLCPSRHRVAPLIR